MTGFGTCGLGTQTTRSTKLSYTLLNRIVPSRARGCSKAARPKRGGFLHWADPTFPQQTRRYDQAHCRHASRSGPSPAPRPKPSLLADRCDNRSGTAAITEGWKSNPIAICCQNSPAAEAQRQSLLADRPTLRPEHVASTDGRWKNCGALRDLRRVQAAWHGTQFCRTSSPVSVAHAVPRRVH